MEAGIMVLQELFRNRFIAISFFLLVGCKGKREEHNSDRSLNRDHVTLQLVNGLVFVGEQKFTGKLFTLYPGGKDTAEVSAYLNGREHGIWKKFYGSGRLKEIRQFMNGQKYGKYLAWWENGQRQLEYHFLADEYQGTCREWNEQGQLSRLMNYRQGYEEGPQKWWYDGGKMKANYIIKDGRRFGLLGTKNCINVSDSIFKN